ncbi:50S ribosomal protein L23 [Candidatus Microgenomates bacterium]|jgi:large subunit ribosomal protein L23|nr:MAG: 50S ribosomal protein L23 [Candidatus Microgenomates bacterium]
MKRLIKPLITETTLDLAQRNWYTFAVPLGQNKNAIKETVEKQFKVKVTDIKTIVVKGKTKRSLRTRKTTKSSNWKKAMVKVKEGQKIDVFDIGA